jgi:hypothetical protein
MAITTLEAKPAQLVYVDARPEAPKTVVNLGPGSVQWGTAGSANPSLPPAAAAFTATGALAAGQSRFTNQGGWWLAAATTQLSVQDGTSPTAYSDPSPVTSLVEVIGNSISTARDYNAMSRVANALGAVEVNYSHPGMVHCWDDAGTNPCGYATARQRMVRFNKQVGTFGQLGYGAESDLVFIASPQNDLWALAATNARAVLKHGIRSIISHALVASIFEETDAALTFTGTWATVTNPGPPQAKVGTGADSSGTGYKYSSTQGDSFTVKIPGDYPGSARSPLVLAFVGYPTAANSTALLTASGAATGTFDLSAASVCDYTNSRRNGVVWRFTGNQIAPSNGIPQTLTITLTTITNAQRVAVDYAGFETDLATGQPRVIVQGVYKPNPPTSAWASVTNAQVANWNADLQSVVAEFGPSVTFLDQDSILQGIGDACVSTTVTGAHNASVTTFTLGSTAGMKAGDVFVASGELVLVGAVASGTSVTGCTRGAWSSTAATFSGGESVKTVNVGSIPNFVPGDGIHWSEDTHRRTANAILDIVAPGHSVDTAGRRGSGGRNAASAVKVYVTYAQVFGSTELPVPFDRQRYDMGGWHVPSGVAIGQPYDQHQFVVVADGQYQVTFSYAWGTALTTGMRTFYLRRTPVDGTGNQLLQTSVISMANANVFDQPGTPLNWTGDLRRGDIVWLGGHSVGIGQGTTITDNPLTSGATSISFASITGLVGGQVVRIENELVTLGGTPATPWTGCSRGTSGTLAKQHSSGAVAVGGAALVAPTATNRNACELTITRLGPLFGSL